MQIMIIFTTAFILFSQHIALASDENLEVNCKRAHADLKELLSKSTKLENLPANWKIQQELKVDFDSDGKTDVAAVLNRTFPLEKNKTTTSSEEKTKISFQENYNFLVILLNTHEKSMIIYPNGPTSPIEHSNSMNNTNLVFKNKVLIVTESVASSMGSWSAPSAIYKWQYNQPKKDFRLIGYTFEDRMRNQPFASQVVDRNLLSGHEIRYDSMRLKPYLYESGDFKPKLNKDQLALSEEEEENQLNEQVITFKNKMKNSKKFSFMKDPEETQDDWIKIKQETKEKPKAPVFLSQFGNCDFSIETVY